MDPRIVTGIVGVVAAAAGGAALMTGVMPLAPERAAPTGARLSAEEICLRTDLGFIGGGEKGCYSSAEIAALTRAPVRDADGPATAALSHPTDVGRPKETARTCEDYRRLSGEGWHGVSTQEMREEAWFTRACGTLALLESAEPAEVSHFADGALSEADVTSLADAAPFGLGEGANAPKSVAKDGEARWRLSGGGTTTVLQEIAHADFNDDGIGDMLIFVSMNAEGGTATASEVGYLEKKSERSRVKFVKR